MKTSRLQAATTLNILLDAFRIPQVLRVMRTELRLLPFMFSHSRLEEFTRHPSYESYVREAIKGVRSQPRIRFKEAFKNDLDQYALSEAYVNYLFDEKERDVINSRQLITLSDMRNTTSWYPQTRKISRKIIYHHGPTNSGKTSAALEALKLAKKGVYMAPLRLLAWQTQQKLLPCSLITGQEKQIVNSGLTSCTIETVDLGGEYDVAVIDEIQLLADPERGWAWTQALLAVKADVIHLCGESRALELVSKLVAATGDTLEERKYSRFSKLHLLNQFYSIEEDLQPGDCIIAFGSKKLYSLRKKINKMLSDTGENKVAIIYGRLPPEVRKNQAQLFNEGTLPIMVSTNAIGMGLNLKIKRIIFSEVEKKGQDGQIRVAEPHLIQQIAGRAGRGLQHGHVLSFNKKQFKIIQRALKNVNSTYINVKDDSKVDDEQYQKKPSVKSGVYNEMLKRPLEDIERQLRSAGIFISFARIERFKVLAESSIGHTMKLSYAFANFIKTTQIKSEYIIQREDTFIEVADLLENLPLSLKDQYNFAMSPVDAKNKKLLEYLYQFAKDFCELSNVVMPQEIMLLYENKFSEVTERGMQKLQILYQVVELYIWLANKYEMAFSQLQEAIWVKQIISDTMNKLLNKGNPQQSALTTAVDTD